MQTHTAMTACGSGRDSAEVVATPKTLEERNVGRRTPMLALAGIEDPGRVPGPAVTDSVPDVLSYLLDGCHLLPLPGEWP